MRQAAVQGDERRKRRIAYHLWQHRGDERLHGVRLPKGSAARARSEAEHAAGKPFRVRVWTGASTGPELDGALAKADGIEFRLPYNSDPIVRDKINRGAMEYFDMHLSQVAPMAWQGFLGPLDTAVVEVTGIHPDGALIPSSSVGNNKTWLDRARKVILEVNSWQNVALEGMHDV